MRTCAIAALLIASAFAADTTMITFDGASGTTHTFKAVRFVARPARLSCPTATRAHPPQSVVELLSCPAPRSSASYTTPLSRDSPAPAPGRYLHAHAPPPLFHHAPHLCRPRPPLAPTSHYASSSHSSLLPPPPPLLPSSPLHPSSIPPPPTPYRSLTPSWAASPTPPSP